MPFKTPDFLRPFGQIARLYGAASLGILHTFQFIFGVGQVRSGVENLSVQFRNVFLLQTGRDCCDRQIAFSTAFLEPQKNKLKSD